MDRREFFKTSALASIAMGTLSPLLAAAGDNPDSEAAVALQELQEALDQLELKFAGPEYNLRTPQEFAEARRLSLHVLQHALHCWLEADPARPFFISYIDRHKKLLGDNPDARYHSAVISDGHSYRIRGNLAGADYTSFTIELGNDADADLGIGSAINDSQFEADENGNYEIIVSREKVDGNWLPLSEGAASITTRHYYEREQSINNDQLHHIPISIENLEPAGPRPAPTDAEIAAGIRRVSAFIQKNIIPFGMGGELPWVSRVPNQFNPVVIDKTNLGVSYAAPDNVYAMAPFVLMPNQALMIRGRMPKCRFCNLVLWNRFLQTFDYETRQVSFNRKQLKQDKEGNFEIMLSHKDTGHPNWLDTEGRPFGLMFWRFQLPEEDIAPLETEVVTL